VTTAKRPSRSGTGHRQETSYSEKKKEENFRGKDWTRVIDLKVFTKKALWRSDLVALLEPPTGHSPWNAIMAPSADLPVGSCLGRSLNW
jgi:hypothetical protein